MSFDGHFYLVACHHYIILKLLLLCIYFWQIKKYLIWSDLIWSIVSCSLSQRNIDLLRRISRLCPFSYLCVNSRQIISNNVFHLIRPFRRYSMFGVLLRDLWPPGSGRFECTWNQKVTMRHLVFYTVSRKKDATDFFAVTFTNIDGFS